MKILTLNINSIRAHAHSFLDILQSGEYDVIMVQELKVENSMFPHNLFDEYGYNIKVFGQKSWNGVAVFSKYSIEDVVCGMPNYADVNARFMECVIDGHVRIINAYMPDWFEHKELILDDAYNLYAHYLQCYMRHHNYSFNPKKGKQIYIVHYVGVEKPWMINTPLQFMKMCKRMWPNLYYVWAYMKFRYIFRLVKDDSNKRRS